jgi:hypothetical protein
MTTQFVGYGKMNRGQMKIQQMAFMLIAVTLLFVLVGIFLLVFKFSGLKDSATALEEKNAMLLVSKLANSPEFSCELAYGNKANCIDADKVMVLKDSSSKYINFWGISGLEIRKISNEQDVICTKSNYPNCNLIKLSLKSGDGFSVSNFASLCRKESTGSNVYDKCELARIIVSYEKK